MENNETTVEQRRLLDLHLRLVLEENKLLNLTRITDWEQGQLLHVEDSLVGVPEVSAAPEGPYLDLGTGGGFPGLPVTIVTGRQTCLVDSVGKKTKALDRIIRRLGLEGQVSTYTGRAEELTLERPGEAAVVTARALSSLPSLMELSAPLLVMGGRLVCYKANPSEEEVEWARCLETKLGLRIVSERSVFLSDGETARTIISFEKVAEPLVKLPRHPGMAQKRPYKA